MRPARAQARDRDQHRTPRRAAILVLLVAVPASLLLAGCGASDRDDGVAAFPPVEQATVPETAWLADGAMRFGHPDSDVGSAWRMPPGSATELWHSGAPYVFEQIVPKA